MSLPGPKPVVAVTLARGEADLDSLSLPPG